MNSFEASFLHALLQDDAARDDPLARALAAQPAFAVYRNTVMKACIDALEANFPAVVRLVGRDWFRAAAAAYVPGHLPRDGRLLAYGDDDFGAFLAALPTAAALPYLAGVARLDVLWRQAHAAPDGPWLGPNQLAGDPPEALAARQLQPHPATRWAWCEEQPAVTIWSRNREEETVDAPLDWGGEGLLLTRPGAEVAWQFLSRAGCALLDACAAGASLGEAAELALQAQPGADLAALLGQLLLAGAFGQAEIRSPLLEVA